jgi:hypothetical protein
MAAIAATPRSACTAATIGASDHLGSSRGVSMIDYDSERRRQKALERLRNNEPLCAICGETNPHCLERHHVAGRSFRGDEVIVCRNCHRKLSVAQRGHPSQVCTPPALDEQAARLLLGLADLLAAVVKQLRRLANELIDQLRQKVGEQ